MSSGKKLETTMEFVQRLTREASERQEALEMEKTREIGQEVKEEKEKGKEEKEAEEKEAEGKKRKWESGIKVSERYNEEDADITIISSDGVSFKVHSLFLVRASPVFKSMLGVAQSIDQRGPLDLTDEFVEHSLVIKATLDILYDQEITSFKDDKLYHHVIEFARKYDMSSILKTISNQLRVHATSPDKAHCLRLLRIAIDLGECDLMTAIVRATCGHVWPTYEKPDPSPFQFGLGRRSDTKPTPLPKKRDDRSIFPTKGLSLPSPNVSTASKEYIEGGKAFDLGTWPYPEFAALPPPLAWALLRAEQLASKEYSHQRTEAFGRELQNVLDSMYPKDVDMLGDGNAASGRRR